MEDDERKETTKRAYEKPVLRTIELVAEEVLAAPCKKAGTNAVGRPTCTTRPCSLNGS
ncbi:MAG TPA: hypothetical protein VEI46_12145 [Thermodesulfovibrionales bacterium]|nr:hypothetical protein [Thermodesulfovibrionales bacterium]